MSCGYIFSGDAETTERAYAKLDISLDVTEKRDDGFHNMVMVMQTVSLCDDITIRLNDSARVRAKSDLHFIPGDERNLAVKAALRYLNEIGETQCGADIEIKKRIPVGAGMGGGSADAAAVLRAMNRLFDGRLSGARLTEISGDVGSDVPFCISGGTALAEGRGERLTPLPDFPDYSKSSICCTRAIIRTRRALSRRCARASWGRYAAECTTSLNTWTTGA